MSKVRESLAVVGVYAMLMLAILFFSVCRLFGVEVDE